MPRPHWSLRLKEPQKKGLLESRFEVLHLAALANVRMPVFNADVSIRDGLTLYEE